MSDTVLVFEQSGALHHISTQIIFERLKEHGYQPEIAYFGQYAIQQSSKPLFKASKLLTDRGVSSVGAVSSSNVAHMESPQTATDKLQLACAVFNTGSHSVFTHPGVFSSSMRCHTMNRGNDDSQHTFSSGDQFDIKLVEDAPYIVHACRVDPNVATAEDMDRRNA
ncbi:hypothetical protein OG21DRAFT_1526927 [Imleria badia]|nr:hypothetical protein OG21DRAFT_1526927 [Imleria badia]